MFSFVHFISLYTLDGLRAFRKPLPYNMYLFNLRIVNYILIKIFFILKIRKLWRVNMVRTPTKNNQKYGKTFCG